MYRPGVSARNRWLVTSLQVTLVVAATSLASALGLLVARALLPAADLQAATNEVGNYLQTVGGIYAVLLAFVVYVVWGQFNEARGYVDQEAAALVDLHRTASGLPTMTRVAIQNGLVEYVTLVLRDEWQAMAHDDRAAIERVGEKLDPIWTAIHSCKPTDTCEHTIYGEVLSQFNELTDIRTRRLTAATSRIPQAMKLLLYSGGVIVIGSMYLIAIAPLWLHLLVTAALAGAIAHVMFLILDLDAAFKGNRIPKQPFERARRTFEHATYVAGCHEPL